MYERSPEEWANYLAEGNATQPRKRVAADALIRDDTGHVLLVEPTYKPGWDLPGGMSEANESPDQTVKRELREELGLELQVGRLLCVDWVSPHGPWDDSLCLVFDGGHLSQSQIGALRLADAELASFEFRAPSIAAGRLNPRLARRFAVAWDVLSNDSATTYLVDGAAPGGGAEVP
jgi:ADP-ribose pyrophosphatase YjhB (NUDIX family)